MDIINNNWDIFLKKEIVQPYFISLMQLLEKDAQTNRIFPQRSQTFEALALTPPQEVKVVLLGQDPYHQEGQANGLAFSVNKGHRIPPSLRNIYKELTRDIGFIAPNHGDLTNWATQGILLLNTTLSVRENCANSHSNFGWSIFTDAIITYLNSLNEPIVFLLWGSNAQKKQTLIHNPIHSILKTSHPSPLSVYRGFDGCSHFSKTNAILNSHYKTPINWNL